MPTPFLVIYTAYLPHFAKNQYKCASSQIYMKTVLKPTKKTLDEMHNQMMCKFHDIETNKIPSLIHEKNQYLLHLKTLHKDKQFDDYLNTKEKINLINQDIRNLTSQKKDYLLKNARDIFQYFEEKQKISSGNNNQNESVLQKFFRVRGGVDTSFVQQPVSSYTTFKKQYQRFWKNVNGEIGNIQNFIYASDVCEYCGNGELIPQEEDGTLQCNNEECGRYVMHIIDSSKPTNKEPPNEVSYTAYIRLNHFKEILSQFQAKETTQIPEEIIEMIRNRIKKERITDPSLINFAKMREILRKLGLNKYFEHIQYINSLFGIQPPIMDEKLQETLCILFIEIQKPWALYCPPDRINFFNYTYTLYQLCVLLDQPHYLKYIPLLKDTAKQKQQDEIWKNVCRDLDWQFFPTV
jgi:hypothetical protein